MSETTHTPTPYIAGPAGIADERGDMLIDADLGNRCIESIGRLWNTHGRAKANADFIVTACNAHEKLVKAVQALLKAHEQLMPGIGHIACSDYAIVNEAPLLGRAALAAAGMKENEHD